MFVLLRVRSARSFHRPRQATSATPVIPGSSIASACQKRPPSCETQALGRREEDDVVVGRDRDEWPRPEAGARLAPGRAAVVRRRRAAGGGLRRRRSSSRAPPSRRGAAGRRPAAAGRLERVVRDLEQLLVVEVDLGGPELARDERAHQPRPISSATTSDACSAAATGSSSRPSVEVDDRERIPGARRVDGAVDGAARRPRPSPGDDLGAPGAERQDDLGHAERAQRLALQAPGEDAPFVLVHLEDGEVREGIPVDVVVLLERSDGRSPEALGVEQQVPAAVAERRDGRRREVRPRRPATCTQAASASGAAAQPRRPRSSTGRRPRRPPSHGGRPRSGS